MSNNISYEINFITNGGQVFANINTGLDGVKDAVNRTTKSFGDYETKQNCLKQCLGQLILVFKGIT